MRSDFSFKDYLVQVFRLIEGRLLAVVYTIYSVQYTVYRIQYILCTSIALLELQ